MNAVAFVLGAAAWTGFRAVVWTAFGATYRMLVQRLAKARAKARARGPMTEDIVKLKNLAATWDARAEQLHAEAAALSGLKSSENKDRINAKLCVAIGLSKAYTDLTALVDQIAPS